MKSGNDRLPETDAKSEPFSENPPARPERPVRAWWVRLLERLCNLCDDIRSQFSSDPLERCRWVDFSSMLQNVSDNPKDRLARIGEDESILFLREKGYRILQRNLRFSEGEIDLVVRDRETLVFVEIKTRRAAEFGDPSDAVKPAKQRRQLALARKFVSICRLQDVPIRFDILSIVWPEDAPPKIDHMERAFEPRDL